MLSPTSPSQPGSSGKGSIQITIQQRVSNAKTLLPGLDMNPASYTISGTGPSSTTFPTQTATAALASATIPNLPDGAWSITVQALNAAGTAIGSGSGSTAVSTGGTATVSITVLPFSGNGTLTINLTWPSGVITSPAVVATLTPTTGGSTINMTFSISSTSASYTSSLVPAGYYILAISLNDGSTNVAGKTDTLRVISGQTTDGTYDFTTINQLAQIGGINVTITPSITSPFLVSISGGQSTISPGAQLNLTASVSNPSGTISYAWYVNGISQNISTASWSGGSSWAVGYYTVDVIVISSDGGQAEMRQ